MCKKCTILFLLILCYIFSAIEVNASTDNYKTFTEIIMAEGKLVSNFTDEEYNEMLEHLTEKKMFGYTVYVENNNVDATYISNTLYSIENDGSTPVTYQIDVVIETKNTVKLNVTGSLSGNMSVTKSKELKGELGAKVGVSYTSESNESRKETQKLDVIVEPNSRCIIYLTGNLTISNGVACDHIFYIKTNYGCFEIVTLKNQYTRIEKAKI